MNESQNANNQSVSCQKEIQQKEDELSRLKAKIKKLTEENKKLAEKNQELTESLQKTKKIKNMEIDTLNKIIKNLKEQIKKLEKNQIVDDLDKYSLRQNKCLEEKQSFSNDSEYYQRHETQMQQENSQALKRNSIGKNQAEEQHQIRDMIHQIRLELADMKHSHLKMTQENEKIHQAMRGHILPNQSYSEERGYSVSSFKNNSVENLNMGECFMGRKSKISNIPETEKSWGRMEELIHNPYSMGEYMNRNQNYLINNLIRPQSQISFRKSKFDNWGDGLQQKLNFIKEENQQLKRSIFQ